MMIFIIMMINDDSNNDSISYYSREQALEEMTGGMNPWSEIWRMETKLVSEASVYRHIEYRRMDIVLL